MKTFYQEILEQPGLPVATETIFGPTQRARMLSFYDDFVFNRVREGYFTRFELTAEQKVERAKGEVTNPTPIPTGFDVNMFVCKHLGVTHANAETYESRDNIYPCALEEIVVVATPQETQYQDPVGIREAAVNGTIPNDIFAGGVLGGGGVDQPVPPTGQPDADRAEPVLVDLTPEMARPPIQQITGGNAVEFNWEQVADPEAEAARQQAQRATGLLCPNLFNTIGVTAPAATTAEPAPWTATATVAEVQPGEEGFDDMDPEDFVGLPPMPPAPLVHTNLDDTIEPMPEHGLVWNQTDGDDGILHMHVEEAVHDDDDDEDDDYDEDGDDDVDDCNHARGAELPANGRETTPLVTMTPVNYINVTNGVTERLIAEANDQGAEQGPTGMQEG